MSEPIDPVRPDGPEASPFAMPTVLLEVVAGREALIVPGVDNTALLGAFAPEDPLRVNLARLTFAMHPEIAPRAESARLNRESRMDELTGIANRRKFMETMQEAHGLYERTGELYACVAIDLDGFKNVNDAKGHDVGDRMLRAFAGAMVATSRIEDEVARLGSDDQVARLGGDEFGVLLLTNLVPGEQEDLLNEHYGQRVATAFDEAITRTGLSDEVEALNLGVSSRLAIVRRGETMSELYQRADDGATRVKLARKAERDPSSLTDRERTTLAHLRRRFGDPQPQE